MVALYCGTRSNQNAPIQLFAELAGVEATEDPTTLGEEYGVQEPCMVVPISSDPADHEVNSKSNPDVDEVPDDINDEGMNEDRNVNVSSIENQIRHIVIHNNFGAQMSRIDPDAARAAEFLEYPEILPAHRMVVYSDPEELFVSQRFESKEEYVFAIKRLATLMPIMGQQQVNQMEAEHVFVEDVRDAMRPSVIDSVYHLGPTELISETDGATGGFKHFIIHENELPVLPDLSTWEVPPTTFELVPRQWVA
ncbi:hypothetical protein GOBAR_DD33071 [Gossypium barbadense]|nr:hypothetical protein GOBAR_DD33071 [Gossypium barbadense]